MVLKYLLNRALHNLRYSQEDLRQFISCEMLSRGGMLQFTPGIQMRILSPFWNYEATYITTIL